MIWRKARLRDLLETSIGGVWGKEAGADELDVRVWRVTELKPGGRLEPSSAAHRSVTKRQYQSRGLQTGDLLLEKSGGGPTSPVGRVGLVTEVPEPAVCSNFMQLLRPDKELVVPRFLHLYLNYVQASGGTAHMQTASTNIRNIKASQYLELLVPLPTLEEQRQIAASLEDHLSRLDAAEQNLRNAVVRAAGLSGLLATRHSSASGNVVPLADMSTLITDGDHNPPRRVESGVPHVTAKGIRPDGSIDLRAGTFVTEEGFAQTAKRYRPTEGDVIVTCVGTVGRIAVVPPATRFSADRNLAAIRLDRDRALPEYVAMALRGVRAQHFMRTASGSTAQPHLYLRDLRRLAIHLPGLEQQERAVASFSRLSDAVHGLTRSITSTAGRSSALRHSLLAAAFSERGATSTETEGRDDVARL